MPCRPDARAPDGERDAATAISPTRVLDTRSGLGAPKAKLAPGTVLTLALPYAGLFGSAVLTIFIGLIISSATSSIIVFAQELMPHRFGMISGVFFGVAFGIGGLGAAVLGKVADHTGIAFVYQVCAFLPAIGLLAVFLPKMPKAGR